MMMGLWIRIPNQTNRTSTAPMGSRFRCWQRAGAGRVGRVARADRVGLEAIAGRVDGGDAAADDRAGLRRVAGTARPSRLCQVSDGYD